MDFAIITGATSGIGKAYAYALAKTGFNLIITGRRETEIKLIAIELENLYNVIVIIVLGDFDKIEVLNQIVENSEGKNIKYLINSVGYGNEKTFFDENLEINLKMINVHIISTIILCRKIIPMMKKGYVINVSSLASFFPTPYNHLYAGTKSFLNSFTESLSMSLKKNGIKVQVLCPGFTITDFHKKLNIPAEKTQKSGIIKWMSAEKVVAYSLNSLKTNKVLVIPGFLNKVFYFVAKFCPKSILYSILSKNTKLLE